MTGESRCKHCNKELPDKRYKFCGEVCKGLYKLDTSTNTGQGMGIGQEQEQGTYEPAEALNRQDINQPLSCPTCGQSLELEPEQAQVPINTELTDWQTKLDSLPTGIPHPASVPDLTMTTVHERILRQGMKKGDWVSTQAYAEQIRRYLYWTESQLIAREHIVPAWVKPLLKGRNVQTSARTRVNDEVLA